MRSAEACWDAQSKLRCSSSATHFTITRGRMCSSPLASLGAAGHLGQAEASKPCSPSNVMVFDTTATS